MKRYKRRKSKTVRPEEVRQGMTVYVPQARDNDAWGDPAGWAPTSLRVVSHPCMSTESTLARNAIKWIGARFGEHAVPFFHTRNACQRHCDQLNRG